MRIYREELKKQMKEIKEKRRLEKERIDAEELKRERKFYEEFKIQAQPVVKEISENTQYLSMMRTIQNFHKKAAEGKT